MSGKSARAERRRQAEAARARRENEDRLAQLSGEERQGGWPDWTPFVRTHYRDDFCDGCQCEQTWVNSRYQVFAIPLARMPGWPPMYYLSFKTHSKRAHIPWRDKQRIKNELCGTKSEAVEIFPSEDRLMDTSNQYHLFVTHPDAPPWPFGQANRDVMEPDEAKAHGARQAPFEVHETAFGCTTHGQVGWKSLDWYEKHGQIEAKWTHASMWKVNADHTEATPVTPDGESAQH